MTYRGLISKSIKDIFGEAKSQSGGEGGLSPLAPLVSPIKRVNIYLT